MLTSPVKPIDPAEAAMIVGRDQFLRAARRLGWSEETFVAKYRTFLAKEGDLGPSERQFFDFLSEYVELGFTLSIWGMVLFNYENGLHAPIQMEFEGDGLTWWLAKEGDHLIVCDAADRPAVTTASDRPVAEALLEMFVRKVDAARLVPMNPDQEQRSATVVSMDFSVHPDTDWLDYLRDHFMQRKERFEKLRAIFDENF